MRCPSCGLENPEGAKFCIECGGALTNACPRCRFDNLPQAKFCAECGMALKEQAVIPALTGRSAAPVRPSAPRAFVPSTAEAERRQLTVMFCDLVGSTPLAEQLDPEDLRTVVQAYQTTCSAVIHRFGGYIARYVGDALLVYFGYPQAHEDDPQRAVRAGLGIVEAMQALSFPNVQLPQALQVRIGVHTGLVVVGELGGRDYREAMALGETPNIAARVQGQAQPNTVVISATTYRLIEGLFECEDQGRPELKGVSAPLTLYRVLK